MKKALLTGVAALLLATGAAHANRIDDDPVGYHACLVRYFLTYKRTEVRRLRPPLEQERNPAAKKIILAGRKACGG